MSGAVLEFPSGRRVAAVQTMDEWLVESGYVDPFKEMVDSVLQAPQFLKDGEAEFVRDLFDRHRAADRGECRYPRKPEIRKFDRIYRRVHLAVVWGDIPAFVTNG